MSAPAPVVCQRPGCGHRYTSHAPGGAHCRAEVVAQVIPCDCAGFRWVALEEVAQPPAWYYGDPFGFQDYGLLPDGTPDLGDSEG